jgi:origin recognition complex subunit 1
MDYNHDRDHEEDSDKDDNNEDDGDGGDDDETDSPTPRTTRKKPSSATTPRRRKRTRVIPTPHSKRALRTRAKKGSPSKMKSLVVRPPQELYRLQLDHLNLSKDPWLRAMHVLHVAARPEALPCREEEYGRVLRAVDQLLEEGSGGCIC